MRSMHAVSRLGTDLNESAKNEAFILVDFEGLGQGRRSDSEPRSMLLVDRSACLVPGLPAWMVYGFEYSRCATLRQNPPRIGGGSRFPAQAGGSSADEAVSSEMACLLHITPYNHGGLNE